MEFLTNVSKDRSLQTPNMNKWNCVITYKMTYVPSILFVSDIHNYKT
jgi:hypothetical protein